MIRLPRLSPKKTFDITLLLIVWAFTVWLLFPIMTVGAVEFWNVKTYFIRTVLGIAIMLVFFGKTIFDLFFPLDSSQSESLLQTIFLAIYGLLVVTGILYCAGRLVIFYFKGSNSEFFSM